MKKLSYILLISILAVFLGARSAIATSYDLTSVGAEVTINGAIFEQIDPQSTGTGVISPFIRIQSNGTEHGYNTGYRPLELDEDKSWTKNLLLSDVPLVEKENNISYRQFLLDINEATGGDNELLSLNALAIYLLDAPNLMDTTPNNGSFDGFSSTAIWSLGNNEIELDYALNSGSGSGDMFAYIPNSVFTGPNQYVYMYSAFGNPNPSGDGFEEWAVLLPEGSPPPGPVPEPATMLLLCLGLLGLGLGQFKQKKFFKR